MHGRKGKNKVESKNAGKSIKIWLIFVGIAFFFWGTMYKLNYNNDTYYSFAVGWADRAWDMFSRNGRVFAALLYKFYALSDMSNDMAWYISFLLGIVFLGSALYVCYNLLSRYLNIFFSIIISMILIMNPLMVDFFFCFEAAQFLLGVLMAVLATEKMVCYFEKKDKKNMLYSFFFLLGAAFCYQSLPGLFIMLVMPFLVVLFKTNIKKFIGNNLIVMGIYAATNIMVLIVMRILGSNKLVGTQKDWLQSYKIAKNALDYAWKDNFGFFIFFPEKTPYYLILFIIGLIVLQSIMQMYICFYKKERGGIIGIIWNILSIIYLFCGAYFLQLLLIMVGYGRPRICYPIGAMFGMYVLVYFLNYGDDNCAYKENKYILTKKVFQQVVSGIVIIYIVSEFFCFQSVIIDKYTTNARDKYTVEIIGNMIEDYEKTTGVSIEKVSFYKDANVERGYADVIFVQDIQTRSFFDWYSDIYSLNFYLGTTYEVGEVNEVYKRYFLENDWDTFDIQQLIFDNTELHICMY